MNKVLFSLIGGLFLVVLIPQNLVYLGVPVRISAWLLLSAALAQVCWCRHKLVGWARTLYSNADIRAVTVVVLLTIAFHSVVPIQQGLEWYYGKGHFDQINYVLLAEFLKEEPYSTSEQDIGLRPWLVRPVGFKDQAEQIGASPVLAPGQRIGGLKKERIGQSIITAEMSVWSGTDGKGGYAASIIFFLTVLAICLYVFLRETGIDPLMAGSGALLAALLPAVTRLSLNGFLSQVSILFVFPFFASMLQSRDLSARSFTLFFSLTLGYVAATYSEIAPIGFCTLLLGVLCLRREKFRTERLMLMSAILITALVNPCYLRNVIEFLGQQYFFAGNMNSLNNLAPNILTLRGWSELIFGTIASSPLALFFDYGAILLGILLVAGVMLLSRHDRLVFATILLPGFLVILYLATTANHRSSSLAVGMKLLSAFTVAAAAAGSIRYYSEVLNNGDLLTFVREPRFLDVCRELEEIKNKRVLVFETHPLLTPLLCYHARHNQVYFDGRLMSDSPVPLISSFAKVPDLANIDFVATRDRILDLRAPSVSCLTLIDDTRSEDRRDGQIRYWLGPPASLRFLSLRPISADLKMQLAPGPEVTTLPVDFFLADDQGHISQGEIRGKNVDIRRMNFPRGLSALELSVKRKDSDPNTEPLFPILAELDGIEISETEAKPGG